MCREGGLVLFVDTCGAVGRVAVIGTGEPAGMHAEREIPGRETQERLMIAMEEVLAEAGLTVTELTGLAVVTGPGSFTGVRIGLAAVKGLAEALELPVVAISRLRWLAATAFAGDSPARRVWAWMDAGRGELYAGLYLRDGGLLHGDLLRCEEESLRTRSSLEDAVEPGDVCVVADAALAGQLPGTVLLAEDDLRKEMVRMVASAVLAREFADPVLLDANYLRVPDAELVLRARQAAALASDGGAATGEAARNAV